MSNYNTTLSLYNACWVLIFVGYYFVITSTIHFGCTQWFDPRYRLPSLKKSKQYRYFIWAHICRVLYLIIAVFAMTFQQILDGIIDDERRLKNKKYCNMSLRIRFTLYLVSIHIYCMFCWYKICIITLSVQNRKRTSKVKKNKRKCCKMVFYQNILWYFMQISLIISVIFGQKYINPTWNDNDRCTFGFDESKTTLYLLFFVAYLVQLVLLLSMFLIPTFNIYTKHKSKIIIRNNSMLLTGTPTQRSSLLMVSRLKSILIRTTISGVISISVFIVYITVTYIGEIDTYQFVWTHGIGYLISYAQFILNYLCLTFSYTHYYAMLFPIICKPPWPSYVSIKDNNDRESINYKSPNNNIKETQINTNNNNTKINGELPPTIGKLKSNVSSKWGLLTVNDAANEYDNNKNENRLTQDEMFQTSNKKTSKELKKQYIQYRNQVRYFRQNKLKKDISDVSVISRQNSSQNRFSQLSIDDIDECLNDLNDDDIDILNKSIFDDNKDNHDSSDITPDSHNNIIITDDNT